MPDDEGLFCLFCGRTEPEHKAPGPGGPGGRDAFFSGARPDEFADTAVEGDLEWTKIVQKDRERRAASARRRADEDRARRAASAQSARA